MNEQKIPGLSRHPLVLAIGGVLATNGLQAATITVDTLADGTDPTDCTLRDAVQASTYDAVYGGCVAGSGADTIEFDVTGTITLTGPAMVSGDDLVISGPGADQLTIDGNDTYGLFSAYGAPLTLSGLTLSGAYANYAVFAYATDLTVSDAVITGNTVDQGVTFSYYGSTSIDNTEISLNTSSGTLQSQGQLQGGGGGICGPTASASQLSITDSVITQNTCPLAAGFATIYSELIISDTEISDNTTNYAAGGYAAASTVDITRTTIDGNQAIAPAGLALFGVTGSISDSTFSNNTAEDYAGGLYLNLGTAVRGGGGFSIVNTTISGNTADLAAGMVAVLGETYSLGIESSTIAYNDSLSTDTAYVGGAAIIGYYENASINNTVISGNSAADGGPQDLLVGSGVAVTLEPAHEIGSFRNPGANGGPDNVQGGGTISMTYSFVQDPNGFIADGMGNGSGAPAELGPLADNGGPTLTHLPDPTSPLVNMGDPGFAPPPEFDQRGPGFDRVVDGIIDVGSVEFGAGGTGIGELTPVPVFNLWGLTLLGGFVALAGGLGLGLRRRQPQR